MEKKSKLLLLLLVVSLGGILGSCDIIGVGGDADDADDTALTGGNLTYLNLPSHTFTATG
jgi:hypothetical protein